MENIELDYDAWTHPRTGEIRFYINNWQPIMGIEIYRYNTGNISAAYIGDEKISNALGGETIRGKVYFTSDGTIHAYWRCGTAITEAEIVEKLQPLVDAEIERVKKEAK